MNLSVIGAQFILILLILAFLIPGEALSIQLVFALLPVYALRLTFSPQLVFTLQHFFSLELAFVLLQFFSLQLIFALPLAFNPQLIFIKRPIIPIPIFQPPILLQ